MQRSNCLFIPFFDFVIGLSTSSNFVRRAAVMENHQILQIIRMQEIIIFPRLTRECTINLYSASLLLCKSAFYSYLISFCDRTTTQSERVYNDFQKIEKNIEMLICNQPLYIILCYQNTVIYFVKLFLGQIYDIIRSFKINKVHRKVLMQTCIHCQYQ